MNINLILNVQIVELRHIQNIIILKNVMIVTKIIIIKKMKIKNILNVLIGFVQKE